MARFTVRIDDDIQNQLDEFARANGYNRSEALELALKKFFEEDKKPSEPEPVPAPSPIVPAPKLKPQPVIERPGVGAADYEKRIAELEHESQQNQFYLGDLFLVLETLSNQVQANCAMMSGGHYTFNPLLEIPAPPWLTGVDLVAPPPRPKKGRKKKRSRWNGPRFGMTYIAESPEDVVTIYHWEDDSEAEELIAKLSELGLEYRAVILDAEAPNARPCVQYQMKTYWAFESFLKALIVRRQ